MDVRIKEAITNWGFSSENGEEFRRFKPGINGIVSVHYHACAAPGDQHYVDVLYNDDRLERHFNLSEVIFYAPGEKNG